MKLSWGDLLTKPDPDRLEQYLADWRWLVDAEMQAMTITALGDVFLEGPGGSVWFLDTYEGTCKPAADSYDEWKDKLQEIDAGRRWLLPDLVGALLSVGKVPTRGECLSPEHPPVLGGEMAPENFQPIDILVHLSIMGQIHKQVKDLPEGTEISGFEIDSE